MENQAECEEQGKLLCEYEGAGAAMIGLMGGALIGASVGTFIRTDKWGEVPLDQLRVSLAPQRDGRFGLGLSVAF
jgi:hypothetical protein